MFWAEREELRQEAMVAALNARRTWDAQCGVPFGAYVWRACMLHLRSFCWRQSAPVYAPHHKLKELRGIHREEVTEHSLISDEDPCDVLVESRWRADVREQVGFLLDTLGEGRDAAARVIVLEEPPARVAYESAIPVSQVYRAARVGRRLMADNALLYALLKDKGS